MATYTAAVRWQRNGAVFSDKKYGRSHVWSFDGGAQVPGSSSPHVVPVPYSDPAAVDPEEAFVAAVSSCHMLWFLSIACKKGLIVESYDDEAEGLMQKNAAGKQAITRVTLRPKVAFSGPAPDLESFRAMHDEAHQECFIANSIKSEVVFSPTIV
jgi:organic hydroperoxide reductase OsmC/OhrA